MHYTQPRQTEAQTCHIASCRRGAGRGRARDLARPPSVVIQLPSSWPKESRTLQLGHRMLTQTQLDHTLGQANVQHHCKTLKMENRKDNQDMVSTRTRREVSTFENNCPSSRENVENRSRGSNF